MAETTIDRDKEEEVLEVSTIAIRCVTLTQAKYSFFFLERWSKPWELSTVLKPEWFDLSWCDSLIFLLKPIYRIKNLFNERFTVIRVRSYGSVWVSKPWSNWIKRIYEFTDHIQPKYPTHLKYIYIYILAIHHSYKPNRPNPSGWVQFGN